MTADVGLAALWGAAVLAGVELIFSMRPAEAGDGALRATRVALTTVALIAFLVEFADSLPAALSALPGQLLLWSALFGGATLIQARFDRDAGAHPSRMTPLVQALLALALLLVLLFALRPFAWLEHGSDSAALDSSALVLGYVGLAMAATIGVGALTENAFSRTTARTMRSWTLAAWIALTVANLVAAEPLGANRLLIPWLAATAVLHALAVVAARGRLGRLPLRGREGALIAAAVLLAVAGGLAVAARATIAPLVIGIAALLMVGPLLRWRVDRNPLWPRLAPAFAVAVLALAISVLAAPAIDMIGRFALVIGFALLPASLTPLFFRPWRRLSLAAAGMAVAHLGFALALIGASWSGSFGERRSLIMHPGETAAIGPWMVHFVDLIPAAGSGFSALEAHLEASRGDGLVPLLPQIRYGERATAPYRQDATVEQLAGELSASLDGTRASDAVRLTLAWHPLASLKWVGGLVMAAGGLLTLIGRALAARRRRLDADEFHGARRWR